MKTRDIAKKYGLSSTAFTNWLKGSGYAHKTSAISGQTDVDGSQNIDEIVQAFKLYEEQLVSQKADREHFAQQKQQALGSILITSGFSFDGYTITKYSGYISGDDAVQIARGMDGIFSRATDVGSSLMASLVVIRRNALAELKEAALALGCNAVIGVDFDYITLDPQTARQGGGTLYLPYVFGVTANGNAVIIEKNNRTGPA